MRAALIIALIACVWSVAAADDKSVEVAAGQRLFANNCAACHQADATGVIGPSLRPDHRFKYGRDPKSLYKSIADGHVEKGCPAWKSLLSDKEIHGIVAYLLSLPPKPQASPSASASPH